MITRTLRLLSSYTRAEILRCRGGVSLLVEFLVWKQLRCRFQQAACPLYIGERHPAIEIVLRRSLSGTL